MIYLALFMFLSGVLVFVMKQNHLILMLLSLEFMVLSIYYTLTYSESYWMLFFSLIFLSITVCEGALGLSILVTMSRSHGGDYLSLSNL